LEGVFLKLGEMTLYLQHSRCSSRQFCSLFSIAVPIFSQIFSDYIRRSPHFVRWKELKRRRCLKKRRRCLKKRGRFSKKHGRFFQKRRRETKNPRAKP